MRVVRFIYPCPNAYGQEPLLDDFCDNVDNRMCFFAAHQSNVPIVNVCKRSLGQGNTEETDWGTPAG